MSVNQAHARDLRKQGQTLQQIADRFGVTRERIRQIVGPAPSNGSCRGCGRDLGPSRGGAYRVWCSQECFLDATGSRCRACGARVGSGGRCFACQPLLSRNELLLRGRARQAVNRAIRTGQLVRPISCERCGGGEEIHAHHHDYEQALDVEWLCQGCHSAHHAAERLAA